MRLRSWFSDWAAKLGIPTWLVWAAAIVVGFLAIKGLLGSGGYYPYLRF